MFLKYDFARSNFKISLLLLYSSSLYTYCTHSKHFIYRPTFQSPTIWICKSLAPHPSLLSSPSQKSSWDRENSEHWIRCTDSHEGSGDSYWSMPGKSQPERRLGYTRVPGHAFLAWNRPWRMVVFIYYVKIPSARSWAAPIRAANTVRNRQAVRPVHHVQDHTCRVTLLLVQPSIAFGLIGLSSHRTQN